MRARFCCVDRADGFAPPHQQDGRRDSGLLFPFAVLGKRHGRCGSARGYQPLGQRQAVGLAVVCRCACHDTNPRRLRARASLSHRGSRFCLAAIADDGWTLVVAPDAPAFYMSQLLLRIGFGVAGLLTIENFWRNTEPERRWHVWPLCLAIGGLFAYELFLFSDAFITRGRVDPGLALGRPIVAAFMAPLLALAMVRNREWRVDIHVSRQVVLHTATLVASGCFLVAVAVVAMLLRGFGGEWGLVLQLAMLFGSIVVLATVLSSGSVRRRLKFLISRNFFTHRYDYRVEWLKFIELVSEPKNGEELSVRIIRVLAEFVDSPAGVLWSFSRGIGYYPTAAWKRPFPDNCKIAIDDPFVFGFRDGSWIRSVAAGTGENSLAVCFRQCVAGRTVVASPEVIGFVVLDRSSHIVKPRLGGVRFVACGRGQAASYLAEERSTKVLRDSELLTEYSKRFAFVVHDIKNLASQLNLIVSNAARHIGDPEFQRDMLKTVEDSVARMNNLLSQLKADAAPRPPRLLNPNLVVNAVAAEFADAPVAVETRNETGRAPSQSTRSASGLLSPTSSKTRSMSHPLAIG